MSGGNALEQVAAEFGFTFDTNALAAGQRQIEGVTSRVMGLGGAFMAATGIGAVVAFTDRVAEQAHTLHTTSEELGISTDQLQAMQLGASDAGVSADELTSAMMRATRAIGAAAHGGKQQAQALHALGVSARGAHGEIGTLSDMLPEIMDGFARIQNPTVAGQRAMDLFGRAGMRLLPFLQRGHAGLADMQRELGELGGGVSQRAVEAAQHYEEAQHRLDVVTMGLKASLMEGLVPAFERIMAFGGRVVTKWHELTDHTQIVQHTLEVLGGVAAAVGVTMLLPWVPLIAAVLGAVIVWDELRTTMDGGDSALSRFLVTNLGAARASRWIDNLRHAVAVLPVVWHSATDAVHDFAEDTGVALAEALAWIVRTAEDIADAFSGAWATVGASFHLMWDAVETAIGESLQRIGAFVGRAGAVLHSNTLTGLGASATASGTGMTTRASAEALTQVQLQTQIEQHRHERDAQRAEEDRIHAEDAAHRTQERQRRQVQRDKEAVVAGNTVNQTATVAHVPHPPTHGSHHGHTTKVTQHNVIHVQGVSGEHVARQIDHRLRALHEEHSNDHDAAHPTQGAP